MIKNQTYKIVKYMMVLLLGMHPVFAKNYVVQLGNTRIIIQKYSGKGKTYIHLHRSETTALIAARTIIKKQGGSLITLGHAGGRNIRFRLDKRDYAFDPNRIFTEQGIKKTLQKNSHYSPAAARQVRKLANKLKALLPQGKIIAVHNNKIYSFKEYFSGKSLARDVKAIYHNPRKSYRNFFLVTKGQDYYRLKKKGENTIWQNRHPTDDGSLSVYLAKRRYINIEAGYNQLAEQKRMLQVA
jgi:hypothetical protein